MLRLILIYLFFAVLSSCTSMDKKREAELHLQIGTGHLNQGRYPDAIRELRRSKELDPDSPIVHNHLAIALYARKQFKDARENFETALSLKPDYTEARNNLGRLLIDMGEFDEAISVITEVTKDLTYPQPEKAYSNLAIAYLRTKNYRLAQKAAEQAIDLNRSDCMAKGLLGQVFYYQKQFVKAAANLDSAVELCKNLDEAHYFGALSYLQMGKMEKARARMKELISLYPESRFADLARAELAKLN